MHTHSWRHECKTARQDERDRKTYHRKTLFPTRQCEYQIAQRRQEITNFYKDSIKHLKVQKEYEQLLTDIEESRAKRMQAQMFLAQSLASQEQELQSEENTEDETT